MHDLAVKYIDNSVYAFETLASYRAIAGTHLTESLELMIKTDCFLQANDM